MTKVFIDGSAGTTGLNIYDRLKSRNDLELIILSDKDRKNEEAIHESFKKADIVFLCLPDAAAKEAVNKHADSDTIVIDTSTAHRTKNGWTYGFPEITGIKDISSSKRIANPGCHASGFIALTAPLVREKVLKKDACLACFSLTGYSGGGKKMIASYEYSNRPKSFNAPRLYGLTQLHKHLREMTFISGLDNSPAFCPVVSDFYSGMEVAVPLFKKDITGSLKNIKDIYGAYYTGRIVHFDEEAGEDGFLSASAFSGRDDMQISVHGNDERILLAARFDNLGKGACGSAIQNLNILLGVDETIGLKLQKRDD